MLNAQLKLRVEESVALHQGWSASVHPKVHLEKLKWPEQVDEPEIAVSNAIFSAPTLDVPEWHRKSLLKVSGIGHQPKKFGLKKMAKLFRLYECSRDVQRQCVCKWQSALAASSSVRRKRQRTYTPDFRRDQCDPNYFLRHC